MFKKRIAFLTATRADYGKLKSLILETQKLKNIKTYVLVAGMHNLNFFGNTIEELFHLTFHFEKCCSIQLAIPSKNKINLVSDKIAEKTCNQHEGFGLVGSMSWAASKKLILNNNYTIVDN